MKEVYVVVSYTGTWFSKMIRGFQRYPYSHTSIGLEENQMILYSFGRFHKYKFWHCGFVVEHIEKRFLAWYPDAKIKVFKLTVTEEEYTAIKKELQVFIEESHRYKYNLKGIVTLLFNKGYSDADAYFCSQFVYEILSNSKVFCLGKRTCCVIPRDFEKVEEILYEGTVKSFYEEMFKKKGVKKIS
ncbi:MAG: hypothetical protein ACI35O_11510 [Bacillaceae bacterium]